MPAVDLSQLPEPAIIAEPDFEAILADTKAMMIASYPAEQREAVSAALELERCLEGRRPRRGDAVGHCHADHAEC
ncbi:hypothetical protein C6956_26020 [Escherichia coli]|nr:hypothetical protein C6956_26020 [Escherichia coli]